ncbi:MULTISPECIES: IS1 family transposase [unclassified Spirosoma]|uniref:IS1/IS1595 family N-terminal zinc-binding domain-containing protein n=1 Tax=unclassified Spirosoma TaxID=2621999 RepID=UPI0009616563|nr:MULTISPECIES: IS1 family transposase [unclassified Spirosoma]MBN8825783.1 IS1 family transposase [Spirosoma sp.]OJW74377.1 MAG: transposase [Spirosoma sp. 48-14]
MAAPKCPKCNSTEAVRNGIINQRQRFRCRQCNYNFTVDKVGKGISTYYVIKALQLYIEGVSFREIERLLGISHVSVMNWVKKYQIKVPEKNTYHPTYKILNHKELAEFITNKDNVEGAGMIITELGDKFMLIKWERFRD